MTTRHGPQHDIGDDKRTQVPTTDCNAGNNDRTQVAMTDKSMSSKVVCLHDCNMSWIFRGEYALSSLYIGLKGGLKWDSVHILI